MHNGWLCHPVIRDENDPARKLILHIRSEHNTKKYKKNKFPWYQKDPNNYTISIPIKSNFGSVELIVQVKIFFDTLFGNNLMGTGINVRPLPKELRGIQFLKMIQYVCGSLQIKNWRS